MNELMDFAKTLAANGFRIFYNPSNPIYLFAVIDGNIGYVQVAEGGGYKYCTVHKPNSHTGTNFHFFEGGLDIDKMEECCKAHAPEWWRGSLASVKKWTLDKFIAAHSHVIELN